MLFRVLKSDNTVYLLDDIPTENLSILNSQDIVSDLINFETIKININEGFLNYIALPACCDKELYVYETESDLIFSDNIYSVCEFIDKINENKAATDFFLNMSYTPAGETLVNGVNRLIPSRIYEIKEGFFDSAKIQYCSTVYPKEKTDLENFIYCIKYICNNASESGKVGVFFSGGVDSLTLALMLEEADIPFTLYTGHMVQGMYDNEKDILRSISIAKFKKWDFKIVPIDFDQYELSDLHEIINIMPNTSHLSVLF